MLNMFIFIFYSYIWLFSDNIDLVVMGYIVLLYNYRLGLLYNYKYIL